MAGHWRKALLALSLLGLAGLYIWHASKPAAPLNGTKSASKTQNSQKNASDVEKSSAAKEPQHAAPSPAAWPQWGGALNSTAFDGAEFFNRARARAFVNAIEPNRRPYVINLNSRAFLPVAAESKEAEARELFPDNALQNPDELRTVYMQFGDQPGDAERAQLKQAGVDVLAYVDAHAWTARGTETALLAAADLPFVHALARIDPRDKLHAQVYAQQTPEYAQTPDGLTRFRVVAAFGTSLDALKTQLAEAPELAALKIQADHPSVLGPRFEIVARADQAVRIAAASNITFVEYIAPPIANRDATTDSTSNITQVRDQGDLLDGSGVKVAVREIGKPEIHVDFDFPTRMTFIDSDGDTTNMNGDTTHATAVVGQIASKGINNPEAKGVAPKATVLIYSLQDGGGGFLTGDIVDAGTRGARLSNHSYGPSGLSMFGDYQTESANWDAAIQANNLIAFFAGNEESDPGKYNHIDFFVGMKNGLCIEATSAAANAGNPFGTPPTSQADGTAFFAKYGPMNDGRVKPDLVAYGENVTLDIGAGASSASTSSNGTSFSTPAATGVATLVYQRYTTVFGSTPSAALTKALLCESATDLGQPGPDSVYGFGIVNADAAVRLIDVHKNNPASAVFIEDSIANLGMNSYLISVPANTPVFKITMCWMDVAGNPAASKALVNDLDIVLIDPNNVPHFPYSLDAMNPMNAATNTGPNTVDPIEQTIVTNPVAGTWTVRVFGTNVPMGPQNFAICTNIPVAAGLSAAANASPTSGFASLDVHFDGSASSGAISSYNWDFGDGASTMGPQYAQVTHTYSAAGTYFATLTVSDGLGKTSTSAPIRIVVTSSTLQAVAIAAPVGGAPLGGLGVDAHLEGDAPLEVMFSAAGSSGNIHTYEWDFYTLASEDSVIPTDPVFRLFGLQVSHTYDTPGIYRVRLKVSDSASNFNQLDDSHLVQIKVDSKLDTDYAASAKGRVNVNMGKVASNQLQISLIAPSLVLTTQQAREAIQNGEFEGKTYTVSAGLPNGARDILNPVPLYSFLVDRHASQRNRAESFKINLGKGTITTSFKGTDHLVELFNNLGISTTTTAATFTMRVHIDTGTVTYQGDYNVIYNGKNGTGTLKGGPN